MMSSDTNIDRSDSTPNAPPAEMQIAAATSSQANAHSDESSFPERFVPGEMHGLIEAEHLARYVWAATLASGRVVLDAGCGVGYGLQMLTEAGAASVTGVDIASEAVQTARARLGADADVLQGDIAALPFDDASFGLVVCFETIEHVGSQDKVLDELRRVLTSDGLLLISSPNRHVYLQGNPYHVHEFTPEELEHALSRRFANVRLVRQQGWLASAIGDDTLLGSASGEVKIDAISKIAGVEPGHETFTLALASGGPLPSDRSLAVLTDLAELDAWQARARSAESHYDRAVRHSQDAQTAYEAANEARKASEASAEAAIRELRSATDRLEQRIERVNNLLAGRNTELRIAAEDLVELRAATRQTEHDLAAWRQIADDLQRSLSWRITAPLRALARAARRA